MSLLKGIFGGNKKTETPAPAVRRISAEAVQSDSEREATRSKMQAEMDAAKAARGTKTGE